MTEKKNRFLFFFIATFVYCIAASCVHPVMPTMILERGLSNSMFGTSYAAMAFTYFLGAPLAGRLCNYHPTRKIMILGVMGYISGQIFMCFCRTDAAVLMARMFSGFFAGGVYTCFANYIINTDDEAHRAKDLTVCATIQSVGSAAGYFVGGMVGAISVETAFAVQVGLLLITILLFRLSMINDLLLRPYPDVPFRLADANPFAVFGHAKTYMTVPLYFCLTAVLLTGAGQICQEQVFNFYIKDQFGMSSVYNGTFKAIIALGSLALNATLGLHIMNKTDIHKSQWKLMAVMAVPLGLMLVFKAPMLFAAANIAFHIMNVLRSALLQNVVASQADKRTSNDLMGLYQGIVSLGSVVGALLSGFTYDVAPILPFEIAFGLFAAGVAVSLIYALRFHPKRA